MDTNDFIPTISRERQVPTVLDNAVVRLIDCNADPELHRSGLTKVAHLKLGQFAWEISNVNLWRLPQQERGTKVPGAALLKELERQGKIPLTANHRDFLFHNPGEIWEEWEGKHIFFFGTRFRHLVKGVCVPWLHAGTKALKFDKRTNVATLDPDDSNLQVARGEQSLSDKFGSGAYIAIAETRNA